MLYYCGGVVIISDKLQMDLKNLLLTIVKIFMSNLVRVNTALISVADKRNLDILARGLYDVNPELVVYSSGGTARFLREHLEEPHRSKVRDVSEYTGMPESPDDLLKTLHHRVQGALLLDRGKSSHVPYMEQEGIGQIELVVQNPYPFEQAVREGVTPREAQKKIDIGGPTMVRAGAKFFDRVAVVVDPADYEALLMELKGKEGATSLAFRLDLALMVFELTSRYDAAVASYLRVKREEVERAFGE